MGMPISSAGGYSPVMSQPVSTPKAPPAPPPAAPAVHEAPKLSSEGSVGTKIHTTA